MNIEIMNIADLKPNENNIRVHSQHQIEELKKSIKQWDVIRPIVVDENGVILVGKGLYQALADMGKETVSVIVKRGLTEKQKKKLMLSDNKIYSLGLDNFSEIEKVIKSLDGDFDVPGYDSDTLEELYGIKSIEGEDVGGIPSEMPLAGEQPVPYREEVEGAGKDERPPASPSKRFQEERDKALEEARNFVICPNCGEKIYL